MTDGIPRSPTGEATENNSATMPLISNENGQMQETPSDGPSMLPNIGTRAAYNLGARTAEHSRILAQSISSTVGRNLPLLRHGTPNISLTSLIMQGLQNQVQQVPLSNNSYVINLEGHSTSDATSRNESINNHYTPETLNVTLENQNNNNDGITDNTAVDNNDQISPQTHAMLQLLQQYAIFAAILFIKIVYDNKTGILMFAMLFITFIYANNNLKREIAKQHNRNRWLLLLILCYIAACIAFVAYTLELRTFAPYAQPLTIWDLLCYVIVMDFYLKLMTVVCKVLLTCLPVRLLAFQNRGKYYFMVEATSQLYRCIAPVQPWLYYLFESYQGTEKIVGILFSIVYTMSKGNDLFSHLKLFRIAIWKLFRNISLGVSPSKEQLVESGGICAICHDKYSLPIQLHCKHIFCEMCVSTWLDRERSCPLCRTSITDNPVYRDGHTTLFIQLY